MSVVDEYQCPVSGCAFHILATGPIDPDEPDHFEEDIEAHRRAHLDDGRVHDVAEAEQMAHAEDAWSAYELLRDGVARQNRERLQSGPSIIRTITERIDAQNEPEGDERAEPEVEPVDIGEDDGPVRPVSSQAGLASIRHGIPVSPSPSEAAAASALDALVAWVELVDEPGRRDVSVGEMFPLVERALAAGRIYRDSLAGGEV